MPVVATKKRKRTKERDPATVRLGRRIDRARLEAGWTKTGLAKRLGATQPQVSKWINGHHRPGTGTIAAIAKLTGHPVEFFTEGLERPLPKGEVIDLNALPSAEAEAIRQILGRTDTERDDGDDGEGSGPLRIKRG